MKVKTFWLLLAVLAVVRLILMATTPVFEPSEARYAAISANMARTGDFVVPHFTHDLEYQSFDGKPPLVFQAGGVFCLVFGVCEFAVRLFPFLSAVLVLFILYAVVKRRSDAATGRLAVVVCATSTAFYAAAGFSMTDITLTCCVAGALLLYSVFVERPCVSFAAGIAALLGAGMITKGPVALALFGLPVLLDALVNHRWRGLFNWRWLAVLPIFLLVAVPWFVWVEMRNPGSVWYFFYNENFMRFISHDYGDKYGAGREAFRGVSIVWAFVATLPWALVPIVCVARHKLSSWNWKGFACLAFLAIVGFWCLTSRVLLYYLFPVIPLFAAAIALSECRATLVRWILPCSALTLVVTCGALIAGVRCSDKMQGTATPFVPWANHYACEFYHGTKPADELAHLRAQRDAAIKKMTEQKAKEGRERK